MGRKSLPQPKLSSAICAMLWCKSEHPTVASSQQNIKHTTIGKHQPAIHQHSHLVANRDGFPTRPFLLGTTEIHHG